MTVKAPYHFVPLSKWVLLPDWAHRVSHDIPFKDGLCGTIEYTLTNASPLLVGDEHEKEMDEKGNKIGPTTVTWAKDPDDKPIIPGSSIKGMLRSVMEIATFSKMGSVEDKSLSYRDLTKNSIYRKKLEGAEPQAAWLKYDEKLSVWKLKYVKHSIITNKELLQYSNNNMLGKSKLRNSQTAITKYEVWSFSNVIKFDFTNDSNVYDTNRTKAINIGGGETHGSLVFSDPRIGSGDHLEYSYLFHENINSEFLTLESEELIKLKDDFFKFHNQKLIKHLTKNQHKKYGIPVFLRIDNNKIIAIGISKLPKIAYQFSTQNLINKQQYLFGNLASFDFTEALFGTTRDFGLSLKSRLYFSDVLNKKTISSLKFENEINKILMTPKETYLAAYIENHGNNVKLNDYNNDNSIIKGTKVYPRNKSFDFNDDSVDENNKKLDNSKIISKLEFLKEGCEFNGEIHFNNIKPEELGAILWSFTFGESNNDKYFHGLGHGKPYGAGNVQIKIDHLEVIPNNSQLSETNELNSNFEEYVEYFSVYMGIQHFSSPCAEKKHADFDDKEKQDFITFWLETPQIQHLLSFAQPRDDYNLKYMALKGDKDTYTSDDNANMKLPDWKYISGTVISRIGGTTFTSEHSKNQFQNCGKGRLNELIEEIKEKKEQKMEIDKGKPFSNSDWEKLKQQYNRK